MGLNQEKPPSQTSLLNRWLNRKKEGSASRDIQPRPEGASVPLSLGQQRLWFLQQLYSDNPFYHYSDYYRIQGSFMFDKLMEAMNILGEKHAIMRTTFPVSEGKPVQKIGNNASFDVSKIDLETVSADKRLAEAKALARNEARRPFNLSQGPLTRITLIRLDDRDHLMLITMHHIITDKWSMEILREDLATVYRALISENPVEISEPAIQYADFAYWQQSQVVDESHATYWKTKLGGELPQMKLPADYPRPVKPSFEGGFLERRYDRGLATQLKALAKRTNSTSFVLLLSAFKVLLHRYTHYEDIIVGTPFSNRDRVSLERVLGFFNDSLVLRSDLSGDPRFIDLVAQVRETVLEAFNHRNTPFESLVKMLAPDRDLATNPIFQVMFLYHKATGIASFAPGLQVEYAPFDFGVSKFDLTLYVSESEDGFDAIFEFAKDLFDAATIVRMHDHLEKLLQSIVKEPEATISSLSMLTDAERSQMLQQWNATQVARTGLPAIHHLFEKHARDYPERRALVYQDKVLTYGELNTRADAIAGNLQVLGLGPGSVVGLCARRSTELIAGIMGILKAGAAYLPLDPEYPAERLRFMVEDAGVKVILAQEDLSDMIITPDVQVCILERATKQPPAQASEQLPLITRDDLAYVIYTSGSTGKPKGVAVTHGNLVHSTLARESYYPQQPLSFLLLSSFAFDSSVAGIFWTLSTGGTLILTEHHIEQDMELLADLVATHGVTHTLLLPSLYALLLQHSRPEKLSSLRTVIVAGEACFAALCRSHLKTLPPVELYNEYGPTEATVWCTVHRITEKDVAGPVPIGRPIANTQAYILDHRLQPVPVGVAGELFISGDGVARGYLNNDELTTRVFLPDPFSSNGTQRMYRTGDLARYRRDGVIEYLGRADTQVKIRGYRVELDEIREAILDVRGVRDAEVIALEDDIRNTEDGKLDQLVKGLQALDSAEAARILEAIETLGDNGSPISSLEKKNSQTFSA